MFSFPPSLQSAPMPSYMSSAASQPTQAPRPSTMPGSVPFRAGDWKCGSEGCGYHNFAKNVSCLRCSASRAGAAVVADSGYPSPMDPPSNYSMGPGSMAGTPGPGPFASAAGGFGSGAGYGGQHFGGPPSTY